ncbi:hypothetical protein [Streptomyces sp. MZ04]|uniref:hypothetical protein n=1 Tax=Streptomyces sp. MZ04 TaxID=2559236 RepID=UPI00107EBC8D|nr:hypothetical protein [Streptomyces sp. MZ04]TGA91874.1 hypothetical protein E2651_37560 [Streptomyces sp. MZ04]
MPAAAVEAGSRWRAVRDLPYLAVTLLNAMLVIQYTLLEVGLPLWIVERTDAPRWTAALLLIVNCVLVALLQVRMSRSVSDVPGAVRAFGRSGVLLDPRLRTRRRARPRRLPGSLQLGYGDRPDDGPRPGHPDGGPARPGGAGQGAHIPAIRLPSRHSCP